MKTTIQRFVTIAILSLIMIAAFSINVSAGHVDWQGNRRPTDSNYGIWWTGEGVGSAWDNFVSINKSKYKSGVQGLRDAVNTNAGAPKPDGGRYTMWETCQKSKFIFWYGSNNRWQGSDGFWYKPGNWYTIGKNVNNSSIYWIDHGPAAQESMRAYKQSPGNRWDTGEVLLICSYAYDKPIEKTLFFKANSGTFQYDGNQKTVSGLHSSSNYSALAPGHTHNAWPARTATPIGDYDVLFNTIVIKDKDGKVVTNQYKIHTDPGLLVIKGVPAPPPPPASNNNWEWRCVDHVSDSAKANTRNKISGNHGFTPSGAPYLSPLEISRYTNAGIHAINKSLPTRYQSKSSWDTWKSIYQAGSDSNTSNINLYGAGVSDTLSKYGGVYNVSKSLKEDTYSVDHCQPEERYWIPSSNWIPSDPGQSYRAPRPATEDVYVDGKLVSKGQPAVPGRPYIAPTPGYWANPGHWGNWTNAGGRIVWNTSGPSTRYIESNYQILSVNCNKSGFTEMWNNYGRDDHSLANWDGGASMTTRETSGLGPGVLGTGNHKTAKDSFYKDGTSCKTAFKCTANPLSWADNDISNNKNNAELFNEVKTGEKYVEVGADKYLTFFRDNNDNEVRADIWHPRNTGLSDLESFEGSEAISTYGKVYSGSPEIELTTIMPWKKYGNGLDYSKVTGIGTETVWSGNANRFIMKSQWTSNKGQPYQMGLNWEYEGEGKNRVPSSANGNKVIASTDYDGYYFDVYCEFENANTVQQANIPDSPFINGTNNGPSWRGALNSIKVFFTRSVSGK